MESFVPSLLHGPIVRDSFEGFFKRGFLLLAGGREIGAGYSSWRDANIDQFLVLCLADKSSRG
jgi:hypothetical protein